MRTVRGLCDRKRARRILAVKSIACSAFALAFGGVAVADHSPVPFISNPRVPTAVAPGTSDFTLIVNGAGFVPNSFVTWNGAPRTTTFVSPGQLTAAITGGD